MWNPKLGLDSLIPTAGGKEIRLYSDSTPESSDLVFSDSSISVAGRY